SEASVPERKLFGANGFGITAPSVFIVSTLQTERHDVPNFESPAEDLPNPRVQKAKPIFETVEGRGGQPTPAVREGLPPSYRMRADPHYVDLLASRTSTGRERILAVQSIDAPLLADPAAIAGLVES